MGEFAQCPHYISGEFLSRGGYLHRTCSPIGGSGDQGESRCHAAEATAARGAVATPAVHAMAAVPRYMIAPLCSTIEIKMAHDADAEGVVSLTLLELESRFGDELLEIRD